MSFARLKLTFIVDQALNGTPTLKLILSKENNTNPLSKT